MKFYPVNINIENKKCVVVGGGKIAFDKVVGLLEAGANVEVIAPKICTELENLRDKIKIVRENYSAEKISEGVILIAATNNSELNAQIAKDARAKHFLVNIVDDISSDFIVPSRIRHDDFLIAISTGGSSPAFSKFVRKMLEQELDENFGAAVEIISKYRQAVIKKIPTHELRIQFWQEILTAEIWENIKSGNLSILENKIKNALT
ncbi:MAG: bifunctional precorrin-2 dehydrogenase/sirohydrochlorin ferrochelatase [Selenomonadaceae bacterium]|nr:bifunctional precorrin-2 dehydrogenase/sirohydrochlorin ferrochelatase [Selenomonadaceae bacterium]